VIGAGVSGVRLHRATLRGLEAIDEAHVDSIDVDAPGAPRMPPGEPALAWL
jgi:hypothetical protein